MTVDDIIGDFNIIGKNQEHTEVEYKGLLSLSKDEYGRVYAEWIINENDKQTGVGFFKDNLLVINFSYIGEDAEVFRGVVTYKCITKDILDGFWFEEYGDPNHLGEERAFRVKKQTYIN